MGCKKWGGIYIFTFLGDPIGDGVIHRKNYEPPPILFAPYGNWSRIGWTEMKEITFCINIAPVSQTLRLAKCQNLGMS
jgi:hypothetical protein